MADVELVSIWDGTKIQLFYTSPRGDLNIQNRGQTYTPPPKGFVPTGFRLEVPVETSVVVQKLVAAQNADGTIEIFFTDSAGVLYHVRQTTPGEAGWSAQDYFETPADTATVIAVTQNVNGGLEVFYINGADGNIYHDWQTPSGAWNGKDVLESLSAPVKELVAAQNQDGRLEIFYTDQTDVLYHDWQVDPGGLWNGPALLGSSTDIATKIAVAQNADGRLEIFYADEESVLYHNWQIPGHGWSGAELLGHPTDKALEISVVVNLYTDPTQAAPADPYDIIRTLEVFYVGTDNIIYHNWQKADAPGGWHGQIPLRAHDSASKIAAARLPGGRLEITYVDNVSGNLYCNWQNNVGLTESWTNSPFLISTL
jgi:hypothetical protein